MNLALGGGARILKAPAAITDLAAPTGVVGGGTLTWTAAPGSTSTQLYRDGVASGTITSPYTIPGSRVDVGPVLDVRGVNRAGTGPASNTLQYSPSALTSLSCVLDETHQIGSPISAWTPNLGAFAGMAASTTQRPAAGRVINGHAAPDFNGSTNLMTSTGKTSDLLAAAAYEYFLVVVADAVLSTGGDVRQNHCLLGDTDDIIYAILYLNGGIPTVAVGHYDGGLKTITSGFGAVGTIAKIINVSFNGSRIRLSVDGGTDQIVLAGNIADVNGTIRIGETSYGAQFFDGAYGTLIACKAEQSAAKRADVYAYLVWKYQTPPPTPLSDEALVALTMEDGTPLTTGSV